jgi:hypothetical protein
MTTLPSISRLSSATLRQRLGQTELILEMNLAWVTAKNIFSNDRASKPHVNSGG